MNYIPIMKMVPGFMSLGVMGEGLKMIPKKWDDKSIKPTKFVKGFSNIMIGTVLIKPTARMINAL